MHWNLSDVEMAKKKKSKIAVLVTLSLLSTLRIVIGTSERSDSLSTLTVADVAVVPGD